MSMRENIESIFKFILYKIREPFQLTHVVEQGYAFYWTMNLLLFYSPIEARTILWQTDLTKGSQAFVLAAMAILSNYSLHRNVIWLRKLLLIINLSIIAYYLVVVFMMRPIPAVAAYLIMVLYLSVFSFLRLSDTE